MSSQQSKRKGRPSTRSSKAAKADSIDWQTNNKQLETDPCDCLYENCPGCWYDCENCGSNKCSPFCRLTRKESQQIEWRKSD